MRGIPAPPDTSPGRRRVLANTAALAAEVQRELGRTVPFDWLCVGITDPSSGLVTMAQDCTPIGPPEVYIATEFLIPDVNRIGWLAGQPDPVGVLSRATGGDVSRSYRYRNALRPSGIEHELRAALVIDGACWGYLVLLRGPGRPDFSRGEARQVRAAVPGLAGGLRSGLLAVPAGARSRPPRAGPECRRVLLRCPDDGGLLLEVSGVSSPQGGSRAVVSAAPAGPLT